MKEFNDPDLKHVQHVLETTHFTIGLKLQVHIHILDIELVRLCIYLCYLAIGG